VIQVKMMMTVVERNARSAGVKEIQSFQKNEKYHRKITFIFIYIFI
jgi:hypothetical protein